MNLSEIATLLKTEISKCWPAIQFTEKWEKLPKLPACVLLNTETVIDSSNNSVEYNESFSLLLIDTLNNHNSDYLTTLDFISQRAKAIINRLTDHPRLTVTAGNITKIRDTVDNIPIAGAEITLQVEN